MPLLCDRPHSKFVDFATSRFVVSTDRGLNLGDRILKRGDEVPMGCLDARALRLEYKAFHIDLLSYAAMDPDLREACARRGITLDAPTSQPVILPELDTLSRRELAVLCQRYGLPDDGPKDALRARLAASVR